MIWNVSIFPHRDNVSEFKAVKNFVAVGLGPLTHNPKFVTYCDKPNSSLRGGVKFMAKRMKVDIPPIPLASKEEFRLLKSKLKLNPKPSTKQLEDWCQEFLKKADGKFIFPKLPPLLRVGVKKFQVNQKISILGLNTEEGFVKLMGELRSEVNLENPKQQKRQLVQHYNPVSNKRLRSDHSSARPTEATQTRTASTVTTNTSQQLPTSLDKQMSKNVQPYQLSLLLLLLLPLPVQKAQTYN